MPAIAKCHDSKSGAWLLAPWSRTDQTIVGGRMVLEGTQNWKQKKKKVNGGIFTADFHLFHDIG